MARPARKPVAAAAAPRTRTASSRRSTAPAAGAQEGLEEEGALGMTDALVILTTVILVGAFIAIDMHMGARFETGYLF
jgi:hypothetical protein